ncbi:cupin domain-containing protein [Acidocella sp.]|jgi:quercetin dioxygenase-like cupin family protein|uniref:cupin domain-containing protein n=1 Tax=Acidocella sp. TaxID=50710 RepID=UPI002F3E9532
MRRFMLLGFASFAFAAGFGAAHLNTVAFAQSAPPSLTPQIIDLTAMTDAQIGPQVPNMGTLRSKLLVNTPYGTVAVQSGNVPKHMHLGSNEIQYIISGSGTFWLGNEVHHIHAGDLIIVPKGVAHAGSYATSGEFKALAIKLPPQAPGDTHMLP